MSIPSATCCLRIWRRRSGLELVVDVLAAGLVLDERERVRELADVVVVGRDAGERADRRRSPPPRARRGCRPSASGGTCRASRRAGGAGAAATGSRARGAGRRSGSRRRCRARRTCRRPRPPRRAAEAADAPDELDDAAGVALPEQRERRHDDRTLHDDDRERRPGRRPGAGRRGGSRGSRRGRRGRCRPSISSDARSRRRRRSRSRP